MWFNVAHFRFGTLIIDGILTIDPSVPNVTIEANNIWLRGGELKAGSEDTPYSNNLTIKLYGTTTGKYIVIDEYSDASTKSIFVTGKLKLFGVPPTTTWTRL